MHAFAFLIALLAVLSFYRLSRFILSPEWALLAAVLLILQEAFFVQSSFVLPEVLLMLLTMESLRSYLLSQKGWFLFYTALLCLTKETGIVVLVAIILFHILSTRSVSKSSGWVYLSLIPGVVFYLLQKLMLGWFFYPLHIGLTTFSLHVMMSKAEIIIRHFFSDQGHKTMLLGTGCILFIFGLLENKKLEVVRLGLFLLMLAYVLIFRDTLGILLWTIALIWYAGKNVSYSGVEKELLKVTAMVLTLIFAFTVSNFLMIRYLLPAYPLLILLFVLLLQKSVSGRSLYAWSIGIFLCINFVFSMFNNYWHKSWHDDVSINYTNAVKVHKEVIEYFELNGWYDKRIHTHFLLQNDLINPDLGYLKSKPFLQATYEGEITPDDELLIFSCIELDEGKYENVKNNNRYRLDKRFEVGNAWCEVYVLATNLE